MQLLSQEQHQLLLYTTAATRTVWCRVGSCDVTVLYCIMTCPQALVEELDATITALTEKMYEEGIHEATVAKIIKDKDAAEARSAKLYKEVRRD